MSCRCPLRSLFASEKWLLLIWMILSSIDWYVEVQDAEKRGVRLLKRRQSGTVVRNTQCVRWLLAYLVATTQKSVLSRYETLCVVAEKRSTRKSGELETGVDRKSIMRSKRTHRNVKRYFLHVKMRECPDSPPHFSNHTFFT